ncbi:glycosyltransferase family 87 protein [Nocardioides campestrisoli]|uniref:glycosyltransferase family 87 protein n=1 Tax=Nocardioides campestrisoli TaxID=2736757 RepID=UPI0015E711CE|nr:glycosyltransferase family 87 protein [Nocardioides campestrisoli]
MPIRPPASPVAQRQLRRLMMVGLGVLALVNVMHAVRMVYFWGVGWDGHAYYVAWDGGLYEAAPGYLDAYLYSPLFAQIVWPLTWLPWPVFCALLVGGAAATVVWLVRPLPRGPALLLGSICSVQVLSANIDWLYALIVVLGLGRGAPWVFPAITKIVSCLGPVWLLARGEWRALAVFVGALAGPCLVSYAAAPHLWHEWVHFLLAHQGSEPGMFDLGPWPLRLVLGVLLTVLAARRFWPWLVPVAMLLVTPVTGTGSWVLLAAIPRLWALGRRDRNGVGEAPNLSVPAVPSAQAQDRSGGNAQ